MVDGVGRLIRVLFVSKVIRLLFDLVLNVLVNHNQKPSLLYI